MQQLISRIAVTMAVVVGVSLAAHASDTKGKFFDDAEDIEPLRVGEKVPAATVHTKTGEAKKLDAVAMEQPTVFVFYRGGWCPYCSKHLNKLKAAEPALTEMGYRLVALSPDKPSVVAEHADKLEVGYTILSDAKMEAAKAFGIAFKLDDKTLKKYDGFGIDLEEASGESHNALPVPAVFVADKDGTIRFVHADPDYRVRIKNNELLAAAKRAMEQG